MRGASGRSGAWSMHGMIAVAFAATGAAALFATEAACAETRETAVAAVDSDVSKPSRPKLVRKRAMAGKVVAAADPAPAASAPAPAAKPAKPPLISKDGEFSFGGAIRARWDTLFDDAKTDGRRTTSNHVSFDTLQLKLDYDSSTLFGSAQWRVYGGSFIYGKKAGYDGYPGEVQFPMWAYAGYKLTEKDSVTAGLNQTPFGLTPYYGASFFQSLGFTMGLEEVYNAGVKYSHAGDRLSWDVGVYPTAAPDAIGISRDSARYSTNMVKADAYVPNGSDNHERNMIVGRAEYAFLKTGASSVSAGVSGWWSQVRNLDTDRDGRKLLGAVHVAATHHNWGFKGIYVRQDIEAKNPGRDDFITVGGFDGSYNLATHGDFFFGEISYKIPNDIGPFKVMPYLDYSAFVKDKDAFKTSQRYILGAEWTYTKDSRLVIYSEIILGKNDPSVGDGQFSSGLAQGGDNDWKETFNVNIGFYF